MKICNQDISKMITAMSSELDQLIEIMSRVPGENLKKSYFNFCKLLPFANVGIKNLC